MAQCGQKTATIPTDHAVTRDEAKAQLAAMGDDDFVSWIGHATFLVRLDGVNVLTDPVFSKRASPMSFAGPHVWCRPDFFLKICRLSMWWLSATRTTIISIRRHSKKCPIKSITAVVPLGLGKYFRGYGYVREVDWYDDVSLPSVNGGFK